MASGVSVAGRTARAFLDTNVFVYADDPREPAKRHKALDLIKEHRRCRTGVVSIQVLQEYFVAATGKLKLDAGLARQKVEIFARFNVAELKVDDILAAIDMHRLHRISLWDALILRCAAQSGCSVLFTEDMRHGQVIDGVRIVNPFI
jgi:predicted nucleic acid-binding protein